MVWVSLTKITPGLETRKYYFRDRSPPKNQALSVLWKPGPLVLMCLTDLLRLDGSKCYGGFRLHYPTWYTPILHPVQTDLITGALGVVLGPGFFYMPPNPAPQR